MCSCFTAVRQLCSGTWNQPSLNRTHGTTSQDMDLASSLLLRSRMLHKTLSLWISTSVHVLVLLSRIRQPQLGCHTDRTGLYVTVWYMTEMSHTECSLACGKLRVCQSSLIVTVYILGNQNSNRATQGVTVFVKPIYHSRSKNLSVLASRQQDTTKSGQHALIYIVLALNIGFLCLNCWVW